jgi:hypothetical protein
MKRLILAACLGLFPGLLCACATYTTPASGVSIASIAEKDSDISAAFQREPAMEFPARLAVARVASAGYLSRTNKGYGSGAFSVLTVRDIEGETALEKLSAMPNVAGVAPLSRLLLPVSLESTRDLRQAAAQLKADAILIYTIDTGFRSESMQVGPLQTIALGMLSTKKSIVTATCSFAIVDVRTGFVYGTGETSATESNQSNLWGSADAADKARQRAEAAAFDNSVDEVGKLWTSIVREHAKAT